MEEEGVEDSYWDTPQGSRELRPTPETLRFVCMPQNHIFIYIWM